MFVLFNCHCHRDQHGSAHRCSSSELLLLLLVQRLCEIMHTNKLLQHNVVHQLSVEYPIPPEIVKAPPGAPAAGRRRRKRCEQRQKRGKRGRVWARLKASSFKLVKACFKAATTVHFPKQANVTCLNDYKPVALTSIPAKCHQCHQAHQSCFTPTLDPFPFAYRENRSTEDAITMVLRTLLEHLEHRNSYVRPLIPP